jgi:acyl-homoserine-lactone acylase
MARLLLNLLLLSSLLSPTACRSPSRPSPTLGGAEAVASAPIGGVDSRSPGNPAATEGVASGSPGNRATAPGSGGRTPGPGASDRAMDPLAQRVEIRRTSYGVPHILAEELGGVGYGLAWVMMEDYREEVARAILQSNGRWGLAVGRDSIAGDFAGRMAHDYAARTYHLLPRDVREVMDGFARGMNDFARVYRDELPEWVPDDFTAHDIAARDVGIWNGGAVRSFLRSRGSAAAPRGESGASGEPSPVFRAPASPQTRSVSSDQLGAWMAWGEREGEGDPEVGSNAWAFAPERTSSGKAILLRNPHLSWTAGYYEAHLRVPGVLDFYGDFRLGGPFTTIGGFNRRLGFATTNNYPVLDQVYALLRDPENPDAYLFDGGSVPLETRSVTVDFKDAGGTGSETREFRFSPLGPVLFETPDTLFILKAHELTQFRVGEQWLRMMQARNLEEWKEAMRIRAKVSSNLTYADADGNILLLWNAAIPALPHRFSGDTAVLATTSDGVWTELYPFENLPQLLNPRGGYVQNSNDPPYYTNLYEPLSPESYPDNFPEPRLRFRQQNSLELVHNDRILSLEDVMELKHSMKMILADRVKDDLVTAVRGRNPGGEVSEAIELVASWDNTVGRGSRGSTLFELWAERYFAVTDTAVQYRHPWSSSDPTRTPRGLGDPEGAADAFQWAVEEMKARFGAWDVPWGEVHRIRAGDKDIPVGGCASALGCFRVLGYVTDEDGKYKVYRGDGWVLAVEFSDPPRAYSVLAYGNSNREDSPYFYDQAELFADNRMKKVAFTEEDILGDLVMRYRPGEERRK